jgi:Cof subfamily protein (haloacid dehalogenase superfamily)
MSVFPPTLATLPSGLRPGGRFHEWQPQRPRYVVLDVDGTLLGATGRATPRVERAVAACRTAGLPVGLATGRMPGACWALADQIGVTGPHFVHNGAEVLDADGPVRRWSLSRAEVEAVLAVCRRHDLYAELYADEGYCTTDLRREARPHWVLNGSQPRGVVPDCDLDRVVKSTVLVFPPEDGEAVLADLAAAGLACGPSSAPAMPGVLFINVTVPGADKGTALTAAASHVGCGLDEVVAVGDDFNDLSMLAVAGTGVAMGQSPAEVRGGAHLVVPEIDADGVAHALEAALTWRALR